MTKSLLTSLVMLLTGLALSAGPLSETKSIPGDYSTIAEAVTALNSGSVPDGGITFNVAAGHNESITAPIILTATGTVGSPIVFMKSGTGANPVITRTDAGSVNTTTLGNLGDGILIIQGSDYTTFDGIDLVSANQGIEYGYYLRKASNINGCSNVTIKNGTITMTRGTSQYVTGIYAGNNSATASSVSISAVTGAHTNITLTGNTISNVFTGILLKGHTTHRDRHYAVGTVGAGNTIQNYGGEFTAESAGIRIENVDSINVNHNNINNTAGGGTPFTGGTGYGIYNISTTLLKFTAAGNDINLTTQASMIYGIRTRVNGEVEIAGNTVTLRSLGAGTASVYYIANDQTSAASTGINITGNIFGSAETFNTGSIYLIYNQHLQASPANVEVAGNSVSGPIIRTGSGGSFYLYNNTGSPTATEKILNNTFSNISQSGTSAFYGIYSNTTAAGTHEVHGNTISNINSGSGTFTGIDIRGSLTRNISGNKIFNITTAGAITGISNGTGNGSVIIDGNEISNMISSSTSGTSPVINGILIGYGISVYVSNNMISDLHATSSNASEVLRGISVTSASTTSNSEVGLYHNTVYLNSTSAGSGSGSSAVYHAASNTSTTASLDLRNNILINTSIPSGSGRTVALRRNMAVLANFNAVSNNNILFAGTPGIQNLIYYDGNSYQTLEAYQESVAPREDASHSELPPFINITTQPFNLRIKEDVPSLAEGMAQPVISPVAITTDIDNEPRASSPDIGADEFNGISGYVANPEAFNAAPASSMENRLTFSPNSNVDQVIIVFNTTGTFTLPSGVPQTGNALAGGTVIYSGTSSPVVHGSLTTGTTYWYKAFSYNGASYSRGIISNSVPGVAPITDFRAVAAGETGTVLTWTKNNAGNNVIVATHSAYINGNPVNGTAYNPGDAIPNGGIVIYRGPASSFSHTGLVQWSQHYYKAWSVDELNFHSAEATTICVTDASLVTTLPYHQNFDGTWSHSPAAPEGWVIEDFLSKSFTWSRNTLVKRTGTAGARGYGSGNCNDYFITPPLILPDEDIQISWWDYTSDATNTSRYEVLISTTGRDTASFATVLGDYTCNNTEWVMHTIDLNTYKGQRVYIAFRLYYTESQYRYFGIDDLLIEPKAPGQAVVSFPTNGMKTFGGQQTLEWSPPATSIPILGYRVYLGTQANPTTMVYDGLETSFLTGALDYASTYYWKVVPYNSNGEATNVPVWSFSTVRQAQLAESFEDEWSPPAGWDLDYGYWWWQSSSSKYHGSQSLYRFTGTTQSKLYMPLVAITDGDKFEFHAGTATSAFQRIRVFYSADKSVWTPVGDEMTVVPGTWTYYSVDLSSLAGGQYYLAISSYYAAGGSGTNVYIDHVIGPDIVPVLPSPARQVSPAANDEWLPVTASLNWWPGATGGVPTGYRVYAGTDGNGTATPTNIINGAIVNTPVWVPPVSLTDNTIVYWKIVPFNNAGDAAGCPVWKFRTAPPRGVQIGRDSVDYLDQPVNPEYVNSYTQAIYLQSEINIQGENLTRIYYQWSGGTGGEVCRDWEIFVGHTSKAAFAAKDEWIPVAQMTKVFDGDVVLPVEPGWIAIDLDIPFSYNNTDNLVIAVHENTPGWNSGLYFKGTDTDTKRALVFYDDYTDPNPASPPLADFIHSGVANIRLQFGVFTSVKDGEGILKEVEGSSINIWPNPAKDRINLDMGIDTKLTEDVKIEIFNMAGHVVYIADGANLQSIGGHYVLQIGTIPKGVYYLRLSGNGKVRIGKFIKL